MLNILSKKLALMSPPKKKLKRSVKISNHRTSISLEKEFWLELISASKKLNLSLNKLITIIDEERLSNNIGLSSATRVWILKWVKKNK